MNDEEITVQKVVDMGLDRGVIFDMNSMLMTREEVVAWYHRLKQKPTVVGK